VGMVVGAWVGWVVRKNRMNLKFAEIARIYFTSSSGCVFQILLTGE